ncbi:hypothetical protein KUTeg_012074 [Tegillarca granosa]|uniref:Uncharacterized protein n=1 Tax=Tegillarca granosa TaxID=220873 RepID=A0ABQ9EYH2_TEGGR|nr:hypothetical protein KUTeg_012074 [Tegillarca granosa]
MILTRHIKQEYYSNGSLDGKWLKNIITYLTCIYDGHFANYKYFTQNVWLFVNMIFHSDFKKQLPFQIATFLAFINLHFKFVFIVFFVLL